MNASIHQNRGNVVVAVEASKKISRTALVWALTYVAQPGDSTILLVVVPSRTSGRKLWRFPIFSGDCASSHRRFHSGLEQTTDITESCSQMMLQLQNIFYPNKINIKIKIISGVPCGAVAAESKKAQANWVIFDKNLKHEKKKCMEELQCNIVVMKHCQPNILRLNLVESLSAEPKVLSQLPPELDKPFENTSKHFRIFLDSIRGPTVAPTSSPEFETLLSTIEVGISSLSNSNLRTAMSITAATNDVTDMGKPKDKSEKQDLDVSSSETDSERTSPSTALGYQPWVAEIHHDGHSLEKIIETSQRKYDKAHVSTEKSLIIKCLERDCGDKLSKQNYRSNLDYSGTVREAISLPKSSLSSPPPLCSVCQHKAPVFGKPPKFFSYAELELATGGFSRANFLAEGGFGSVHRGALSDGQIVAIKQHKVASSQGDLQFYSEVEVLSCAQHRNVVMLIGLCVEDTKRLLVYEYICNGSLHSYLYGHNRETLQWSSRHKIAVGAARGLRYLHEEFRKGCIVHHDMRPSNILLTHDFEALVGDFGLARWQTGGDIDLVESRVIGTFGYLAPEYVQSGQITEKADVYSFGVVLVELLTGRKAVDIDQPKGQKYLTEWARPLLEECAMDELVDSRLGNCYSEQQVYCMMHAALMCIRRDPHLRPRMSQVLHILEEGYVARKSISHHSTPCN